MSGANDSIRRHSDLTAQAAEWLAALDAGTADTASFEAWRNADLRHAVAFAEVAATWRDLDTLRLIRDDTSPEPAAEPVPAAQPAAPPASLSRRHALRAAVMVAAVAVGGSGMAWRAYARDKAVSDVGERKSVKMGDGTAFDLNTDSCIYWKDGTPNRLWLERGEVAIRLDGATPLDCITPGGTFRLDPGLYNARLRALSCELTVLEGSAEMRSGDAGTGSQPSGRVAKGQIVLATAGRTRLQAGDEDALQRVVAWRTDTLVLNGQSLDYAVQEMNRYLPHKIVIGDPGLSRLRLGGTFSTTRPNEFLGALRSSFEIRAVANPDGGVILTRA